MSTVETNEGVTKKVTPVVLKMCMIHKVSVSDLGAQHEKTFYVKEKTDLNYTEGTGKKLSLIHI